ncbi:MAG: cell division protein ZapD [Gammaproteobacteria bacterium]|nr:cell division protein ZapD [Gammaproteobacteria bacterium]
MKDYQIYEQPINKRIRSMMRLELLFDQLTYFSKAKNTWDNTNAVNIINDILAFTNRTDIKSEVIKELERQQSIVQSFLSQPDVSDKKPLKLLEEIKQLSAELYAINGSLGQNLQQNIILNAAKQKNILPGSSGNFDSPLYIQWINQSSSQRSEQLIEWSSTFEPLSNAIKLALKTIRNSGDNIDHTAENGFYQDNLELSKPYQLIRVAIPNSAEYFPEISAGKHRFSIRFLQSRSYYSNPEQVKSDIPFILCNCYL